MKKRIAVGGSASNPPHLGHRTLVQAVWDSGRFDEVHWLVSGQRRDKPHLVSAQHRFAMAQLNFAQMRGNIIVNRELQMTRSTIAVLRDYQKMYPHAEIVWYLGADHFAANEACDGICDILRFWEDAETLLRDFSFLIIERSDYEIAKSCLPQKWEMLSQKGILQVSSSAVRKNIRAGKSNDGICHPDVIAYIARHKLY